ncbi:MAG: hypothetical protein ACYTAQ_16550, partial [Planctomycetota bacterium]
MIAEDLLVGVGDGTAVLGQGDRSNLDALGPHRRRRGTVEVDPHEHEVPCHGQAVVPAQRDAALVAGQDPVLKAEPRVVRRAGRHLAGALLAPLHEVRADAAIVVVRTYVAQDLRLDVRWFDPDVRAPDHVA